MKVIMNTSYLKYEFITGSKIKLYPFNLSAAILGYGNPKLIDSLERISKEQWSILEKEEFIILKVNLSYGANQLYINRINEHRISGLNNQLRFPDCICYPVFSMDNNFLNGMFTKNVVDQKKETSNKESKLRPQTIPINPVDHPEMYRQIYYYTEAELTQIEEQMQREQRLRQELLQAEQERLVAERLAEEEREQIARQATERQIARQATERQTTER